MSGQSRPPYPRLPRSNAAGADYFSIGFMVRVGLGLALWFAISFLTSAAGDSVYSIRWNTNSSPAYVEVAGVKEGTLQQLQAANPSVEQWQQLFPVYTRPPDSQVPPMLGSYRIENGAIRFQPGFPLQRGLEYHAVFRPGQLPGLNHDVAEVISTLRLPAVQHQPTTVVSRVFPSDDVLPENLLKFYIHFSAPMRAGRIYQYIHLRDDSGKAVDSPFLELDEELWNPEMTRLTLFIDPGRIKRGVKPLEDQGPALEKGKRYTLEIDASWCDAAGLPLLHPFRKLFRVAEADRQPLDPATWKIKPPKAGTHEALTVNFSESIDHALALRVIGVAKRTGEWINGTGALSDCEKQWSFVPQMSWTAGPHQLRVENTIEDLAGNNIGKVFDVDVSEGRPERFTNEVVSLFFEVK